MSTNLDRLLNYRQSLAEKEDFLEQALVRIDEQIHVLQIEQLHLIGTLKKPSNISVQNKSIPVKKKIDDLDLNVPIYMKGYNNVEEEEDEEDQESIKTF